jgi:transcriptional regulator with XRE-family HTH domain
LSATGKRKATEAYVSDSKTLIRNLKSRLRADGVTYKTLAKRLGLSEPTVKRDLSRGGFSLERLDQMCHVVGVTIEELLQPPTIGAPLTELSAEQEHALVNKPKLLLAAYLTANDWKFAEIVSTFQIDENELIDILLRLEKLGIAEFRPPNRVRKLTARNFSWRKDGPVHEFFLKRVVPDFFGGRFEGRGDDLRFIGGLLSAESLLRFKAGVDRLAAEFEELARNDARLPLAARDSCTAILALRAWEFSEFARLRRRKK